MTLETEASSLLQLALVARAFFFVVCFTFAGFLTIRTNQRKHISVNILGCILIFLGLFNVFMMIEWIQLFYF